MDKSYFLIFLPVFIIVFAFGDKAVATSDYQVVPNYTDQVTPPTVYIHPSAELQEQCQDCTFTTYRLVRQLNCGATEAIKDPGKKPTCTLIPRVTKRGAIELTWDTNNTKTAFIDKGVGHVSIPRGARIITPVQTTEYNMTVINEGGLVNNCSARIEVIPANIDPVSLDPIPTPEVDILIDGQTESKNDSWFITFIKSWWWVIILIALVLRYIFGKVKNSLGI